MEMVSRKTHGVNKRARSISKRGNIISMPKTPTRTDALLHPVRMRIVIALQDDSLNAAQIARILGDVPLTTLYRHLNILLAAGTIEVAKETPTHGAVEREFRLVEAATYLDGERDKPTAEEILGLVNALTGVVQGAFGRYIVDVETMPPPPGEMTLVAKSVYLTTAQNGALRQQVINILRSPENWHPAPDRSRRLIGFFTVPDAAPEPNAE